MENSHPPVATLTSRKTPVSPVLTDRTQRALVVCDRGALAFAGLFLMLFLVALTYMLVGFSQTIATREGLQDGADAASYSAAIFHARGMNLIVFINLLMSALVAVLVALRMAQGLMAAAATLLTALAWTTSGATAPLAAYATSQAIQLENAFQNAKNVIEPVLRGLHTTQEAVSVVVPWVAMTDGMIEAAVHHPPAKGAFALPPATSLPIESDEFSVLCGKGTEIATRLALKPIDLLGVSNLGAIYDLAESLGESTSQYLCGDGSGAPPEKTLKYTESVPAPPGAEACTSEPDSSECKEAQDYQKDAEPDAITGECQTNCGWDDPYESRARRARFACEPGLNGLPGGFRWQRRTVEASFLSDGISWQETSRKEVDRKYMSGGRPCGPDGEYSTEWNLDSGFRGQESPHALCVETPRELDTVAKDGTVVTLRFFEALRLFSCEIPRSESRSLAGEGDSFGGKGSEDKSPHRLEEDIDLGEEAFQIRTVAFGDAPGPSRKSETGVRLALQGQRSTPAAFRSSVATLAQALGSLSVAQSEFYFDTDGSLPRAEWMWNMHWTARLRRFRLPSDEEQDKEDDRRKKSSSKNQDKVAAFGGLSETVDAQDACETFGGKACDETERALFDFNEWVKH